METGLRRREQISWGEDGTRQRKAKSERSKAQSGKDWAGRRVNANAIVGRWQLGAPASAGSCAVLLGLAGSSPGPAPSRCRQERQPASARSCKQQWQQRDGREAGRVEESGRVGSAIEQGHPSVRRPARGTASGACGVTIRRRHPPPRRRRRRASMAALAHPAHVSLDVAGWLLALALFLALCRARGGHTSRETATRSAVAPRPPNRALATNHRPRRWAAPGRPGARPSLSLPRALPPLPPPVYLLPDQYSVLKPAPRRDRRSPNLIAPLPPQSTFVCSDSTSPLHRPLGLDSRPRRCQMSSANNSTSDPPTDTFLTVTSTDHGALLWIAILLCLSFSTIITAIRLVLRQKNYGRDDAALAAAQVCLRAPFSPRSLLTLRTVHRLDCGRCGLRRPAQRPGQDCRPERCHGHQTGKRASPRDPLFFFPSR